jgi:hypothetical protein
MMAASRFEFLSQYVAIMFHIKNVRIEKTNSGCLLEFLFLEKLSSMSNNGTNAIEDIMPEKLSYQGKASKIPLRIAKTRSVFFFILFFAC